MERPKDDTLSSVIDGRIHKKRPQTVGHATYGQTPSHDETCGSRCRGSSASQWVGWSFGRYGGKAKQEKETVWRNTRLLVEPVTTKYNSHRGLLLTMKRAAAGATKKGFRS